MRRSLSALVTASLCATMLGSLPLASVGAAIVHAPRVRERGPQGSNLGWASSNWSGYAVTGSGFTAVTGNWTVPTVTATRGNSYSSSWAGIDGFNNSNLIQSGTEQDWVNGAAQYDAWWEILPAAETVIPSLTIHPGDSMSVTITKGSGSSWTITLSDNSTGKSFSTTQTYTGAGTSAEWIEEAPTVGGRIAPLAHYSETTFDPGTVNGKSPGLTAADGGVMIQKNRQVSTPSNPDGDSDGFNVQYGSTQPAPPAS